MTRPTRIVWLARVHADDYTHDPAHAFRNDAPNLVATACCGVTPKHDVIWREAEPTRRRCRTCARVADSEQTDDVLKTLRFKTGKADCRPSGAKP